MSNEFFNRHQGILPQNDVNKCIYIIQMNFSVAIECRCVTCDVFIFHSPLSKKLLFRTKFLMKFLCFHEIFCFLPHDCSTMVGGWYNINLRLVVMSSTSPIFIVTDKDRIKMRCLYFNEIISPTGNRDPYVDRVAHAFILND